jgi:DNA-binding MarR family transcriptional regulator
MIMEDTNNCFIQDFEYLIWDFLDLHGFTNSRKAETTLMAALTMFLVQHGRTQMKDIASAFNVTNSTVTDYVDYLEKRDFVKRVRSDKDRREVYVQITEKGQDWIKRSRDLTEKYMETRLSRLTPEERRTFIYLINKVFENDGSYKSRISGEESG